MNKNEKLSVLILGATGEIGGAIADVFSKKEYNIFLQGRNHQKTEVLADKFQNAEVFTGDINDKSFRETLLKIKPDIFINALGVYLWESPSIQDEEKIDEIFETNLTSPFKLLSKILPSMKERKFGRVINIGSISGVVGEAFAPTYSSAKAGLIGMTKAFALEYAEYNVTVNMVNPGWVKSAMAKECFENSGENELECVPMKRFVTPEEIAETCAYLVSDGASTITGQNINLCAGLTLG